MVFIHEFGHALDWAMTESNAFYRWAGVASVWKDLHASEMSTHYGNSNIYEDFADSFASYVFDPIFKCYAPGKHSVFNQVVRMNSNVYGASEGFPQVDCSSERARAMLAKRQQAIFIGNMLCAEPRYVRRN